MNQGALAAIGAALGSNVESHRPLSGGDINDAAQLTLKDGRLVFVKTHASPPQDLYQAEALGLAFLASTESLRVPKVLSVGDEHCPFLALEFIEPAPRNPNFDQLLGRGLAKLHRVNPGSFGATAPNFIATLPQDNSDHETWAEFVVQRRLRPMVKRAVDNRRLSAAVSLRFDALFSRMDSLVGPPEAPSALHGDLWGGNLHVDEHGNPCIIDPAVYAGHREMDLAMMRLFGGFGPRVFATYEEAFPLAAGCEERVPLCQLYPLLVHVNLFGGSYVSQVDRALSAIE